MITNKSKVDSAESLDETSTVAPRNSSGKVITVGANACFRAGAAEVWSEEDILKILDREVEQSRKFCADQDDQQAMAGSNELSRADGLSLPARPLKPKRLLTLDAVLARVPVAPQTIYNWERDERFPRRISLPEDQRAFWLESEVDDWIDDRARPRIAN